MAKYPKPETECELNSRVIALSGKTLSQLANEIHWSVPSNLKHDKGWIGQLIEVHLGASAGNLSEPDFQNLGIELKTIPLNTKHKAKETTYVCTVPLLNHIGLSWEDSCVYHKLSRVLWLPIEAEPSIPVAERKVGLGFIWSPSKQQMQALRDDWEEFMELISLGQVETITAHLGEHLQIRPKAANASVVTTGIGHDGLRKQTLPRGFYLRTSFTNQILKSTFQ
ncbi:MAG: DNA mismatch repair endonuclease MutH [gamma proteobacterium symbiont of Bathyaustriella thionipta]|nr:DNA mismatch repair endonuclease MutH [gamma proteobacterium symbiont of Bathyaustriella thionipta]MCU7950522.1 DNA mismatch repair endonuclease MutH [gamma proteobacterium symbiont of Bathyaustriella thionipta]MCU7952967.1 DNA mismatch repair endonuclease MutH [gamma proteobacterium symbiont of Bathyaustriella thionipta]MCU7957274.1 DNA mismatch repair endonuclease MutH [gamma proteobacterium symbiont of Bathyaustriella thionipta]MCU7966149.1 DNA mismatch repair endonuclease MutH [gamma pro